MTPHCAERDKHPTNRCLYDNINWAPDPRWKTCPACGEDCELVCIDRDDPVLNTAQSTALQAQIEQERQDELDAASAQLERRISAATAALRHDFDHWMEADPADWVPA
jgi:hypothetical protein